MISIAHWIGTSTEGSRIRETSTRALAFMRARYALSDASLEPEVFWRITDNWVELSVRFLVEHRGVRVVKDQMTRDILRGFDAAGILIASSTYEVVGLPELRISHD